MLTVLLYVVVIAVVAALIYLLAVLVFGRGEELPPVAPGSTLTALPHTDVTGDDVRGLRFQQAVRGYKALEVDWALARLAEEIDGLRAELSRARAGAETSAGADEATGTSSGGGEDQEQR